MPASSPPDPAANPPPARPSLAHRLQPWAEFAYKLLVAAGAALALWRAF